MERSKIDHIPDSVKYIGMLWRVLAQDMSGIYGKVSVKAVSEDMKMEREILTMPDVKSNCVVSGNANLKHVLIVLILIPALMISRLYGKKGYKYRKYKESIEFIRKEGYAAGVLLHSRIFLPQYIRIALHHPGLHHFLLCGIPVRIIGSGSFQFFRE